MVLSLLIGLALNTKQTLYWAYTETYDFLLSLFFITLSLYFLIPRDNLLNGGIELQVTLG